MTKSYLAELGEVAHRLPHGSKERDDLEATVSDIWSAITVLHRCPTLETLTWLNGAVSRAERLREFAQRPEPTGGAGLRDASRLAA